MPQCRSLILTTFGRPGYLRRAMESGAYGFIVKRRAGRAARQRDPAGHGGRAGGRSGAGRGDARGRHLPAEAATASIPSRTSVPSSTRSRPGEFCFPPLASLITGGSHLLLALLERLVTDRGGTYAMEDTDSIAIVASKEGGLVACPFLRARSLTL